MWRGARRRRGPPPQAPPPRSRAPPRTPRAQPRVAPRTPSVPARRNEGGRAMCDPKGAVGLRDDRSGLLEEHPTGARELHVTARAPEQRRLEFLLQPPDLLAQRWLRDVETRGRPAEVQLLGHGNEVPEVSKLHGWSHIINVLKIPERYIGHSPHPRRPLSSRIGNARMERGTPLKI